MNEIKIMLVDDQLLFLESLKMVIDNLAEDIKVISIIQDGEAAIRYLKKEQPDIILMDVRMPGMDGVTATRIIHKKYPDIQVIMLTTFEDDEYVKEVLQYGAKGYMLKNIPPQMLITAIRAVHNGSVLISPDIASHLLEKVYGTFENAEKDLNKKIPDWYLELAPKEKEILKLMLQGYSNKEIAFKIHIGSQTIRNYVSSMMSM